MKRIKQQMDFLHEIDKVKDIFRESLALNKRRENDAEHSWHMAMVALTLKEYFIEKVDLEKSLKMILIHDLIEIYAGDTPVYGVERPDKRKEETQAAKQLFSILPEDQRKEFLDLWLEFEDCETSEAKYANVCDRYQGFMQNLTSDGHTWKKFEATMDQVLGRVNFLKLYVPELFEKYILPELEKYRARGIIKTKK
ncbi:HD domain-containing protein [Psychrilyobacter atlanticus]|uniref:HD domain-containing protein n=1 Tax=Psychrilyobacter atlanticus TaxID=271091 RepID=UPI000423459F|nr:HD domain-containing protein [Psychrilyobacter atlanticus]